MITRLLSPALRPGPVQRVEAFALMAGLDAAVRGILISVMPLALFQAVGQDAALVSRIYFAIGIASLVWGLMVPWATQVAPRRLVYMFGSLLYLTGAGLGLMGGAVALSLAILLNALATVTVFVCLNAYVLDYVERSQLGRSASLQMLYAAVFWVVGPMLGVWLWSHWAPAPFLLAGLFAAAQLIIFWLLRLGNGRQIARGGASGNPLGILARFFAQPRLIAGWLFATIRSCGWWVYVVYLPIFCAQAGLGETLGGLCLSLTNCLLFAAPVILRLVNRMTVRRAVVVWFGFGATLFVLAGLSAPLPVMTVVLLVVGSVSLVVLDVAGGLPFLMAVRPSERTEMAAIYSSFRDVSGILTPGVAWLVLLVAPVAGIFVASGLAMGAAAGVASRLHPRLGTPRPSHGAPLPGA
jgi:MFS transporter, ACDE family, multidrug resistance protein